MTQGGTGLLLAFEGIDGCGKSTQLARLSTWLAEHRPTIDVLCFREPGGTPLGEDVRELLLHGHERSPLTEMLLYMAARAELYASVVGPALAAGRTVLLDRSHYSTLAYQGAGSGVDDELVRMLAERATAGRAPDRVVLLELDGAEARQRRAETDEDVVEARGQAYFERVAGAYRRLADAEPRRFVVVSAAGAPEVVAARVLEGLADVL